MDAQRFDELARKLGRETSRRGALRGFTVGLGALVFGIAGRQAQIASADVGAPCTTNNDCDENEICFQGFCDREDGDCAQIGESCGAEIGCCQGTCLDGICNPPCITEGSNCGENPEASCGDLVCSEGVCTAAVVCAAEGESCGEIPCCGEELTCFQTVCSIITCSEEGDPCTEIACCAGTGLVCNQSTGMCEYESTCAAEKESCTGDEDCCSPLACSDKGFCETPKDYCGVPGDECEIPDHNCCNGLTCFEGLCDNPSGLCMDEWEYCDGKQFTCCSGLVCGSDYFCHAATPAVGGDGTGPAVTSLPDTGSGSDDSSASWINAAALGGAAATLGAAYLRTRATETGNESGT